MDFFTNEKIHHVAVERVPCAFAPKNRDGSYGTHYIVCMLDDGSNMVYLSSQCEEEHGPSIEVLSENESDDTCHHSVQRIREYWDCTKSSTNPNVTFGVGTGPLHTAVRMAVKEGTKKRRWRERERSTESSGTRVHRALSKAIQALTGVPYLMVSTDSSAEQETSGAAARFLRTEINIVSVIQPGHVIPPYRPLTDETTISVFDNVIENTGLCHFCRQSFKRPGRHLKSKGHRDRVEEVLSKAEKLLSTDGLKVLNRARSGLVRKDPFVLEQIIKDEPDFESMARKLRTVTCNMILDEHLIQLAKQHSINKLLEHRGMDIAPNLDAAQKLADVSKRITLGQAWAILDYMYENFYCEVMSK